MRKKMKAWMFRILVTVLFIAGLLLVIILNPALTYANKTVHGQFRVYHQQSLDPQFLQRLDEAAALTEKSELYNSTASFDICLQDGSVYPKLIRRLRGDAFAWGFYDKVVLEATMNSSTNDALLHGYRWNLVQLLAHEMTHCLQYKKLGLWRSNPIGNIPLWKWEGYAEYVARNRTGQDLASNIGRFLKTDKNDWAIYFEDGRMVPKEYYQYWLLVCFCIDIRQNNFETLLADPASQTKVEQEMMQWYAQQSK